MNILLVTERSAGHIFPALAIGKALDLSRQKREHKGKNTIFVFTTSLELQKYTKKLGFVNIGKCFSKRNIILEGIWRFFESFYVLLKFKPKIVIGFGGRDSLFLVLIGCFLFKRTYIYEPNISFGRANKFLSKFVSGIFRGLGQAKEGDKVKTIGIPLREGLVKIKKSQARKLLGFDDRPVVFCFGGSQGSVFINDLFLRFVKRAGEEIQVIHLTGSHQYLRIKELYNTINNIKYIRDFDYRIHILYSASDVVLCRSGAATLGEISYFNIPSVLIPHPSVGGHQKQNAEFFTNQGAALCYDQENLDFDSFSKTLLEIAKSEDLQLNLKDNLSKIKGGIGFENFSFSFDF